MRVYLHYLGPPEHTKVFRELPREGGPSVSALLSAFVLEYNARYGSSSLHESQVAAKHEGARLAGEQVAAECLPDRADVSVIILDHGTRLEGGKGTGIASSDAMELQPPAPGVATPPAAPEGRVSASASGGSGGSGRSPTNCPNDTRNSSGPACFNTSSTINRGLGTGSSHASSSGSTPGPEGFQALLARAAVQQSAGQLLTAVQLYQQALQQQPQHVEASRQLAALLLAAGRVADALEVVQACLPAQFEGWQLHTLLGDCHLALGDGAQALTAFKTALSRCLEGAGAQEELLTLQVRCARALHAQGGEYGDAGAQLVMTVLGVDPGQGEALRQYARVAAERGLWGEVMKVGLRLVVVAPHDAEVHRLLAAAVATDEGWRTLTAELAGNPEAHAALAFLAISVKEQGAVQQGVDLLRMALQDRPLNSSYAVNLAHALELLQDLAGVVQEVAAFLRRLVQHGGASCAALGDMPLDVQACLDVLEGLPAPPCATDRAWLSAGSDTGAGCSSSAAPGDQEQLAAECAVAATPNAIETGGGASSSRRGGSNHQGAALRLQYSQDQLDFLALLMTAVKVLFVGGALQPARRLCALLAPSKSASVAQLHRTTIRNEAAYEGCIQQLLEEHWPATLQQLPRLAEQPVYLLGDSHVLPGAWRTVQLRGEARLLHPLLVTGLKIWHLREGTSFYPKVQWQHTLALLPHGAQVVLVLGEIDCREGLATAVAHLKYLCLEDAVEALLDVWVPLLLTLVQERHLELFIHPVPPVLEPTRPIVRAFVAACRRRVQAAAALPQAAGRLHWLELWDQLLTPDGGALVPKLQLDGTHMSPVYLKHLQASLDAVA